MSEDRERPPIEKFAPEPSRSLGTLRGIVSPCRNCKNNIQLDLNVETGNESQNIGPVCPKRRLYQVKKEFRNGEEKRWIGPIYDKDLKGVNPVYPRIKGYNNEYSYIFLATYEDNVENNWNPTFETEKIHCQGPYLIKNTEKELSLIGHLEERDPVLITQKNINIEDQEFFGFAEPSQVWKNSPGKKREEANNLGSFLPGNS